MDVDVLLKIRRNYRSYSELECYCQHQFHLIFKSQRTVPPTPRHASLTVQVALHFSLIRIGIEKLLLLEIKRQIDVFFSQE
jgi:hypothetical protein